MARKFSRRYGVSTCFHCAKQLVLRKGGGGFIFAVILDPDGHELRVHKDCVEQALGHGYRRKPANAATQIMLGTKP